MKILLTGASGMLGHYIQNVFAGHEILTLGRGEGVAIRCDLRTDIPQLPECDLLIHAAGTECNENAVALNLDGTRNLIMAMRDSRPGAMVHISSWQVYGLTEGNDIDETHRCITNNEAGQSKFLAERELEEYASEAGLPLAILRPATMFGSGMKGWAAEMYDKVARGTYVHVRDTSGLRSIVTALDVAKAVDLIAGNSGVYNVTDGRPAKMLELAEAMSENRGDSKRMWTLPGKWASCLAKIGDRVGAIGEYMNTSLFNALGSDLTFSNARIAEATGISFHNTLEVISRKDSTFPYEDE